MKTEKHLIYFLCTLILFFYWFTFAGRRFLIYTKHCARTMLFFTFNSLNNVPNLLEPSRIFHKFIEIFYFYSCCDPANLRTRKKGEMTVIHNFKSSDDCAPAQYFHQRKA